MSLSDELTREPLSGQKWLGTRVRLCLFSRAFSWLLYWLSERRRERKERVVCFLTQARNTLACIFACLCESCPCFRSDCAWGSVEIQDSLLFLQQGESEANWFKCVLTSRWETLPLLASYTSEAVLGWKSESASCAVFFSFWGKWGMRASVLSA
jgi:hypothetical protein